MAIKTRGRRAATNSNSTNFGVSTNLTFGGDGVKRPITLDDGGYDVTIVGARFVTSKKGTTSVLLSLETADGDAVRIQPMLVMSPGGDSDLTELNRALLSDMAGLNGESVGSDDLIKRLTGASVGVDLVLITDRDGLPMNRIVDCWLEEA